MYPSAEKIITCSLKNCINLTEQSIMFLTYQVNKENDILQLQTFLNKQLHLYKLPCGNNCQGVKTITTNISKMHIFIDILYWEGE